MTLPARVVLSPAFFCLIKSRKHCIPLSDLRNLLVINLMLRGQRPLLLFLVGQKQVFCNNIEYYFVRIKNSKALAGSAQKNDSMGYCP